MSEVSDALIIAVSEETGAVSIAMGGRLERNVRPERLTERLLDVQDRTVERKRLIPWKGRRKMKERLTNNLGLKFIAVFFTIVLWLVVMNVEDPIDTRTFKGISVGIRNDDIITSKGKTYSVVGEQSVEVTVKAKNLF